MSKYNLKLKDPEHPYTVRRTILDVQDEDWEREQRRREWEDESYEATNLEPETNSPTTSPI